MSHFVGDELTEDLLGRLSGRDLESVADKVILVVTMDDARWPHPAMLSYFEVVALDQRNIRMATYTKSNTTKNMRNYGKATLLIIDERVAYYIKGRARELKAGMDSSPHNSKLNFAVEQVLADEANEEFEPGAYVAGGITYRNPNRAQELLKAREVLQELLA